MSKPIKKPIQTLESYSPKTPEIVNMAQEQTRSSNMNLLKSDQLAFSGESYSPKKPEILAMVEEANTNIYPEHFMLYAAKQNSEAFSSPRCPEMQPFTTSIRAFLDYTGQNYGYVDIGGSRLDIGFTLICNLSGEAYVDDLHMCDGNATVADYEGYKNMFHAFGYRNYELIYTKDTTKEAMKNRIIETLTKAKTPLIVDNLVECPLGCTVVGYEKNGEVLIGWNYHVFDFSPNPEPQIWKKENWYEDASYVAFLGERANCPELKELYQQGIITAYNTLTDDGASIKNADYYDSWKRYFTQTEEECIEEAKRTHHIIGYGTPPASLFDDDEEIRKELVRTVDPAWCAYSERRYYAKFFMRQAKQFFPEQEDILEEIACCFEKISHTHMEKFIGMVGYEVDRDQLRNPAIRAEMGELIEACRREEEKAIALLKQFIEGYNSKIRPVILEK